MSVYILEIKTSGAGGACEMWENRIYRHPDNAIDAAISLMVKRFGCKPDDIYVDFFDIKTRMMKMVYNRGMGNCHVATITRKKVED
jgi:hypothetical protein